MADLLPVGGNAPDERTLGPGQEVPIATVHPNPRQPRTRFNEASLNELIVSVRANGILQPLLVRPRTAGGYEIVAGERRFRAALRVGLKHVPVVLRSLSDEDTLALGLIENLIREDLGPLEAARAFHRLMEDFSWTQEEMGKRVGKSRSAVANALRLLRLPPPIQEALEQSELSEGHARALIGEDKQSQEPIFRERQLRVFRQIREKGLTVRDVERMMREEKSGVGKANGTIAPMIGGVPPRPSRSAAIADEIELAAVEQRFRDALGTKIRINGSADKGKVEIDYFSADELEGLLLRLENVSPNGIPTSGAGRK
jgi:ParB family chromosome partitioning protein